jgi:hypothetical protein
MARLTLFSFFVCLSIGKIVWSACSFIYFSERGAIIRLGRSLFSFSMPVAITWLALSYMAFLGSYMVSSMIFLPEIFLDDEIFLSSKIVELFVFVDVNSACSRMLIIHARRVGGRDDLLLSYSAAWILCLTPDFLLDLPAVSEFMPELYPDN